MSQLIPFSFKSTSVRVVSNDSGDILFVASDVARALGYDQPHKAITAHCKKSKLLIDMDGINHTVEQNQILDAKTKVIPESDVYRLIMRSKLESAEAFQDWVVEEVLPSIRKTRTYSINGAATYDSQPQCSMIIQVAESAARMLRMSDTSKIRMLSIICEENGLSTKMLPNYTDETLTSAIGDLLKEHGINLSAVKANLLLEKLGILDKLERRSTKGTVKHFWSITEKGLYYGKNETSVRNPNETQPRWFSDKFDQLINLI